MRPKHTHEYKNEHFFNNKISPLFFSEYYITSVGRYVKYIHLLPLYANWCDNRRLQGHIRLLRNTD